MDKETLKKRLLESNPDTLPKTPEGVIFGDRAAIDEFQKTGIPRRYKAWSESHYFYFDNHAATETVQRLAESDNIFMQFARTALAFFVSLADDEIDAAKECLKNNPDIFDALAAKIVPGQQMELFPQAEGIFTAAFCEELKRKTSDVIEFFNPTYPANKKILRSKLAQNLPECINADNGKVDLTVNTMKKTIVRIDTDKIALSSNVKFTLFDRQVHEAVCTLWGEKVKTFTAEQIYRAINNLPPDAAIFGMDSRLAEIEESLEKISSIRITIDDTEQWAQYFPKAENIKIEHGVNLLYTHAVIVTTKMGNPKKAWELLTAPPVYAYTERYNQLSTVPFYLLDTRKKIKNTKEVSLMRDYLSGEIEYMRHGKRNETILYSTIFEKCEINENGLAQAQRNRKRTYIKKILEAFTENGYIGGYEETKKGRTYNGVKIILNGNARKGN